MMLWPWERGARGPAGVARVDGDGAGERHDSARLIQVPPLPDIPEFRARPRGSW